MIGGTAPRRQDLGVIFVHVGDAVDRSTTSPPRERNRADKTQPTQNGRDGDVPAFVRELRMRMKQPTTAAAPGRLQDDPDDAEADGDTDENALGPQQTEQSQGTGPEALRLLCRRSDGGVRRPALTHGTTSGRSGRSF